MSSEVFVKSARIVSGDPFEPYDKQDDNGNKVYKDGVWQQEYYMAIAIPKAAEIAVEECPTPKVSYSLSERFGKPEIPSS